MSGFNIRETVRSMKANGASQSRVCQYLYTVRLIMAMDRRTRATSHVDFTARGKGARFNRRADGTGKHNGRAIKYPSDRDYTNPIA
jgi:hypothetical protein